MPEFRITYRPARGAPAQALVINEPDAQRAIERLRREWVVYSIVNVSVRCDGETERGYQCRRWTSDGRCFLHREQEAVI